MEPKEKAQELFLKYYNRIEHTLSIEYVGYDWDIAKTCTLIAVDEMINVCYWNTTKEFLLEVKKEIEAL